MVFTPFKKKTPYDIYSISLGWTNPDISIAEQPRNLKTIVAQTLNILCDFDSQAFSIQQ